MKILPVSPFNSQNSKVTNLTIITFIFDFRFPQPKFALTNLSIRLFWFLDSNNQNLLLKICWYLYFDFKIPTTQNKIYFDKFDDTFIFNFQIPDQSFASYPWEACAQIPAKSNIEMSTVP
jgi:hypothetical protein